MVIGGVLGKWVAVSAVASATGRLVYAVSRGTMYPSSLKFLFIEDNPGDARLIRATLRKIDTTRYEMRWVDRLSPSLEQLTTGVIDVVLLDLSLPNNHGSETMERTLSVTRLSR